MRPMTDPFQEQISGFVDDELSADECEFLVRRLQRDPDARSRLVTYHVIGAALRAELNAADPNVLRQRLQDSLNGVARTRETPAAGGLRLRALAKPLLGAGIAAAVAAIAVLALQTANFTAPDPASTSEGAPLQAAGQPDAGTYVVPRDNGQRRLVSPPIWLTNYLMQHGEYASHLTRTSVHSNVVATGQPEMTEQSEDDGQ